ncbi:amidohydrolase family protein [Rhizorhabdus wittichii]|uniref:amidohydrolase family protein n=1 Tax=Rhizorhabdus wittichii TaxID=160791 RepID=UPI00031D3910|nr:amidohydrolase family protein [Rhizorhabdus wittichii]
MATTLQKPTAHELLPGIRVVDADTHVSEWYDLWTSRAPAKYRDRVPQVRDIDGRWDWIIDGQTLNREGASSAIRKDGSKTVGMAFRDLQLADVHPGAYDLTSRIAFMDREGIAAQIAYPNLLGFGGQKSMMIDEELRNVSMTIFNDAMAEMQADSGNRIYPMTMVPWWDVKLAVKEAERCAAMGLRGINMNSDPHLHGLPHLGDPHWYPLWEACSALGLPVNFHIGASDESMTWFGAGLWPGHPDEVKLAYGSLMLFVGNMRVLANILLTRVLERFPALKIVSVESGAGWVPFFLEALEYQMREAAMDYRDSPKDVFRRQIYICSWFERDDIVHTARKIGIDNLMFETDFPHPTCLYPDSFHYMEGAIGAMTPQERGKIFGGNAQRIYNLDLSRAPF